MTQKKSLSERRPHFVTGRYMLGKAKRGWSVAMLIFIVFMLFFTIQSMMYISSLGARDHYMSHEDILERVLNYAVSLRATFVVLSCLSAIFAGCYFFAPMHNKTSAVFFHSLPERRSGHFISVIFSSAVSYILGAVTNFVLVLLVFAANGRLYAEVVWPLLSALLLGVFYFIVFLSFTMLAGSVSGTTAIHAIMTLFLLFFIPAMYISVLMLLRHGVRYLDVGSMMGSLEAYNCMSPVFRAISVTGGPSFSRTPLWLLVIIDILVAAGAFALAFFAYKKRPVERTGTPIIYAPLSEAVKYIIIGPSAVLMSEIFGEFFDASEAWRIIGFLVGLLLSFMLCNTVLNRSAKAMFSHRRGMLIYSASACVAALIFATGMFGIFDYSVPVSGRVTVNFGDADSVTFTEKDDVKNVRQAIKDYISVLKNDEKTPVGAIIEDDNFGTRVTSLSVSYDTPFGIPLRYRFYSVNYKYIEPIIDVILDSDTLYGRDNLDFSYSQDLNMRFSASSSVFINDKTESSVPKEKLRDVFIEAEVNQEASKPIYSVLLKELLTPNSKDFYQRQTIGYLTTQTSKYGEYNEYYDYSQFPLCFEDLRKLLEVAYDYNDSLPYVDLNMLSRFIYTNDVPRILSSLTYDEYIKSVAKCVRCIKVYNVKTGEVTKYESQADIEKILPSLASLNGRNISPLTKTDADYSVIVEYNTFGYKSYTNDDFDADKYPDDSKYDPSVEYQIYDDIVVAPDSYQTWFLRGDVPDIVK